MKVSKAIKRLQLYTKYRKPDSDDNFHESVQLGIEALKRVEIRRDQLSWKCEPLLPNETPEDDTT